MYIPLLPCAIAAAVGAIVGWMVRDRDVYKSRVDKDADAGVKKTAGNAS